MAEGDPCWRILIEETRPNHVVQSLAGHVYSAQEEAQAAARTVAREHRPRHPYILRRRTVLQHDDGTYTVLVHGLVQDLAFRVSVVRELDASSV
ncbi:hypothetical protein RIF23_14510 [Lipingzhangella sp. LS1_29]|uniref:Uncharacterized protein n=1 Tax=Lipingzhangella rawalii TaxID=2055835 RepID=A0ABU2H874_9ACTN|nr:hypothetical protein [Lipingzhangella rawalii]MDS1271508.1 hypothetical protein [Lipingzhangella rawalii]